MILGCDNLLWLRCHGGLDSDVIFQGLQKEVTKGSLFLFVSIIVRLRTIWNEVLVKLGVSFDGILISKVLLLESIQPIETNMYMVLENTEV